MRYRATTALCLAALLLAGCGRAAPEEVESETAVPVTTAPAITGAITAHVRAAGVITPAPGAELTVVAPEAARIVEMPKAEGDVVRAGDLLVRFEIPTAAAEAQKQQAEIQRAQARVAAAQAAETRLKDLFERGVAARREVEEATREVADAQADLTGARAAAGAANTAAARSVVRATFNGVVSKRAHNPGDFVEAAASDPVLTVVDPRRLEVTAQVALGDVLRVRVGAPAQIADAAEGTAAALKVASLPAAVKEGTATVPVRLAFAGTSTYPVGAPVQVDIDAESHDGVVLVPAEAVVHEGEEAAVFVVAGDKAQRRAIRIGLEDDEHAEVTEGLKTGETVVTSNTNGLPDGAAITTAKPDQDEKAQ